MILWVAHKGGDAVVADVEHTMFIDDDLHVVLADESEGRRVFEGRERGVKPTIAKTFADQDAFEEHAPDWMQEELEE